MRIFTFEGLDFGFSERYRQKLAKNCAKYIFSIKEKSDCLRQVSEKTEVEDLDLSELRILVLGFRPTVSDVVARKFHSEKLLVKEASKIEVPGRFSKPTKTIPIPLLYIYKKKAKVQIAAKLIKLLSELYVKLADCYANLQFNLTIGSYWQVLAEYKSEIKALGEALFIDINDKFPECIRVHGLLLDQFFITKLQQELFLEDTLHMPSVEKKDLSIAIENDTKLEFNVPDDQAFSDSFLSKICESNVSLSTLCSEQTFPENTIEVQDFSEPNKIQAKRLILNYQQHLAKNYFFRCKEAGEEKRVHTNCLLDTLREASLDNFSKRLDEFAKANYLSQHRDNRVIQKIGKLFKGHDESKGFQLIKSLQNLVETELTFRKTH